MTAGTQYAPAFMQGGSPVIYTGSSKAYPFPVQAGNLLIATPYASNIDPQVSDTMGNTWIEDASVSNGATDLTGIWHAIAKRSGPNTVNFTGASGNGWIMELSIVTTLDQVNSGGGVGVTTWTAGTIHAKRQVEFLIARVWAASGGITKMSGWTQVGDGSSNAINYLIAGAGFDGAVSGGCTIGNETAVVASYYGTNNFSYRAKCRPLGV